MEIITVTQEFNVPAETIWRALTYPVEMKKWYFDLPGFKPEAGYKFTFKGGPSPDRQYTHLCEIIEAIENIRLSYTWKYEGFPGNSLVAFDIIPDGDTTVVRLTHSGIDTFPAGEKDFDISNFRQGWNAIINKSLKEYLAK